jgi:putative oxidoreductase
VGPRVAPSIGLLVGRALVGLIMAAHGWQKLTTVGPSTFGQKTLAPLNVPFPETMGYVVTFTELVGGVLLIAGLLTRLAAVALTVDLVVAVILVKLGKLSLISPQNGPGVGIELELALIAGFLVALFAGPGRLSLDRMVGIDGRWAWPLRS